MRRLLLTGTVVLSLAGAALPGDAAGAVWVTTQHARFGANLALFANGVAYALHDADQPYVRSTDFGLTWTPMPSPFGAPGGQLHSVRFATPALGYAVGWAETHRLQPVPPLECNFGTHFARTGDGGQTWTEVCLPTTSKPGRFNTGAAWPFSIVAVLAGSQTVTVLGTERWNRDPGHCEDTGVVNTSHDAGAHWTRWLPPTTGKVRWYPNKVEWLDSRTATLILNRSVRTADWCYDDGTESLSTVWVTRDGGTTFRRVLDCPAPALCTAASFVTRNRLLVGHTNGTTKVSDDGGRHWRAGQLLRHSVFLPGDDERALVDPTYRSWVFDFAFVDERNGFASTRGGGTWRTSTGGKAWSQERSHECHYWRFGIGDIVAVTKERVLTGGPGWISARIPSDVEVPPCPRPGQTPDVADEPMVSRWPDGTVVTVWPDARVTLRR